MAVQFLLFMHETCPACDASGNPCQLCGGRGYTETRADLVQALQQLGFIDAMRSNAQGLQELREGLSQREGGRP